MKPTTTPSRILWQSACAAILTGVAGAESVAFVASFTSASHTADTVALLQGAGHTVTVVPAGQVNGVLTNPHTASGLTRKAYLESFDLVLISRASGSADYTDKAGWAGLEVPVISMNAYAVRGADRLHWFSAAASDQGPADPDTIVSVPTHPVWSGVALTAGDTRANLFVPLSGNNVTGGTGTFGTGTLLGTSTGGSNVSTIVVWEDGAQLAGGNVAADRRVFFAGGGYANFTDDGSQTGSNTAPLTADGDIAFLNAVEWALSDDPNPDSDNDGLLDAWELANFRASPDETVEQILAKYDADDDPDEDEADNGTEFDASSNPNLAASVPGDIDGDSFPDTVEIQYFGNLNQTPGGDFDGDYSSNIVEINANTSPTNANVWPDVEPDGMADGWESANGLLVGSDDSAGHADDDGFTNLEEFRAGTDPRDTAWAPGQAKIAHRWSFSGDLDDSVGGSDARIANDDVANAGISSSLAATALSLNGGGKATSDFVLLGNNLLSGLQAGGVKPVTIELWATHNSLQAWSRIWEFGTDVNGDPGANRSLRMSWSVASDLNNDAVAWQGQGDTAFQGQNNAPYRLGVPYHIVMTIVPAVFSNGAITQGATVTWYSAPAAGSQDGGHPLNVAKGSFNTGADLRSLADSVCYLGRSMWPDATASATYDEVRIWKGALTETERELFQLLGPDEVDRVDSEPDGFPDAWELVRFGDLVTAAAGEDSDGDGFDDEVEFGAESDPDEITSTPEDRDGDGLADQGFEMQYFNNLLWAGEDDPDGDQMTNAEEQLGVSNPANADSSPDFDGDGLPDGWEKFHFYDADSQGGEGNPDGDFDSNLQEYQLRTNPSLPDGARSGRDRDGDGLPDFWEFTHFGQLGAPSDGIDGTSATGFRLYGGANDPDLDTVSNAQEFADGTDPNDGNDFRDVNGDAYPDGRLLIATDGFGTSSFNAGTNWAGALAPAAGSNYLVTGGFTLRTPNVANQTTVFAGDRLALATSQFWLKGANSVAQANYVFDGVTVRNAEDIGAEVTLAGNIQVVDPSTLFADNGAIVVSAKVTGNGGLVLSGNAGATREVRFNNATNTWTGDLTVNPTASLIVNGVLSPGAGSVFHLVPRAPGAGNTVGGGGILNLAGTFDIDLSQAAPTASGSTWNLLTTATRVFAPGFTVTGSGFTPDGAAAGSRLWTSGDGGYEFDEGSGILRFVGTPPGYVGWAGGAGLIPGLNDAPEDNAENDPYANLLEYQLGGDPLAFDGELVKVAENPAGTHLVFTFERYDLSESDSTLNFRWSTDLAIWNTVPVGGTSSPPDVNGVSVTVTEDGGATADHDLIEIQLPVSNEAGGRLFGQLEGTRP
jgi:hypothetical protein